MDRKNRELAKKNTELLEEISRLTDIHSDMLKVNIKERYYRRRRYNKLVDQVDNQIRNIKEVLEDSMILRKTLLGIVEPLEETVVESDTSVFKQTMKILDTIGKQEEDSINKDKKESIKDKKDSINKKKESINKKKDSIKESTEVLKEKNLNKPPKRIRKCVPRK